MKPSISVSPQTCMRLARTLSLAAGAALALVGWQAHASSHREAPFISMQPAVDGTDFYMFRSYEPGRSGYVTLIADYIPFQDPQGGPNFYPFDTTARYAIHIDDTGNGRKDSKTPWALRRATRPAFRTAGGPEMMSLICHYGSRWAPCASSPVRPMH